GPESTAPDSRADHSRWPFVARSPTTEPPSDPTYTTPFATAGEERTAPLARKVHRTAPVAASSAITRPSLFVPLYTVPPDTAGDDWIDARMPVPYCTGQRSTPGLASTAETLPSREPKQT